MKLDFGWEVQQPVTVGGWGLVAAFIENLQLLFHSHVRTSYFQPLEQYDVIFLSFARENE
jgi:hypothetical protein